MSNDKPRQDVYVRARNILRAGLRTVDLGDGVAVDYARDPNGVESVAGVEVLEARGVEIDGLDVVKQRPHGTGPEWALREAARRSRAAADLMEWDPRREALTSLASHFEAAEPASAYDQIAHAALGLDPYSIPTPAGGMTAAQEDAELEELHAAEPARTGPAPADDLCARLQASLDRARGDCPSAAAADGMSVEMFGRMSREQAHEWIADRQARHQREREAECDNNGGHLVMESGTRHCPRCGRLYEDGPGIYGAAKGGDPR